MLVEASRLEQILDNIKAAENTNLTLDELALIEKTAQRNNIPAEPHLKIHRGTVSTRCIQQIKDTLRKISVAFPADLWYMFVPQGGDGMNKILTALYNSFYTPPQAADAHAEIRAIHKQLIMKLNKPERRLVLRLIDTKDHLAEELSMDSFACGFQLAWRLASELNDYPRNGRPTRSAQAGQDTRCAQQECWELPNED